MSTQCCSVKSLCIDPANPVQNFSAEAPDLGLFISVNTGWDNTHGGYNTPPIGGLWLAAGCQYICTSTISQEDADDCASRQQLACADNTWQNPKNPLQNYLNQQQSCVSLCPDGSPFSFTIPAGTFLDTNLAKANEIAASFACTNARLRRICMSSLSNVEACVGSSYTGIITASGGLLSPALNIWALVAGGLPNGLSFPIVAGPTSVISGVPTQTGQFNFTMRVTAPNGDFSQKQYSICVIDIFPATLPDAMLGSAYLQTLTSIACAAAPLNYQVTSGVLPPGLSLDQNSGIISGTPTANGTFTFTVTLQTSAT